MLDKSEPGGVPSIGPVTSLFALVLCCVVVAPIPRDSRGGSRSVWVSFHPARLIAYNTRRCDPLLSPDRT